MKKSDCSLEREVVSLGEWEWEGPEWVGGACHGYKKVWHISEREWAGHCHDDQPEEGEGMAAERGSHCRQGNWEGGGQRGERRGAGVKIYPQNHLPLGGVWAVHPETSLPLAAGLLETRPHRWLHPQQRQPRPL